MSKCINPEIGKLIHSYEMNKLSDKETELIEMHLMECEACFADVKQMEQVSNLLLNDVDMRLAFRETQIVTEPTQSVWAKLKHILLPDTNWYAKPALIYLAVLLLIYPAYKGLSSGKEASVRSVATLSLFPDRSVEAVRSAVANDIILRIVYPDAEVGISYSIRIQRANGESVFSDDEFNDFDKYGSATLFFPAGSLKPGEYTVEISGSKKTGEMAVEYKFLISK